VFRLLTETSALIWESKGGASRRLNLRPYSMLSFRWKSFDLISQWTLTSWLSFLVAVLSMAYVYEQVLCVIKQGSLAGPMLTSPFIDGIIHMITAPYDFWHG
jgi:hypothetical protein